MLKFFRFRADNPGWWFAHCHFLIHHIKGMAFAFRIGEHSQIPKPPVGFPHSCGIYEQPPLKAGSTTRKPGHPTTRSSTKKPCKAPPPGCPGGPYGMYPREGNSYYYHSILLDFRGSSPFLPHNQGWDFPGFIQISPGEFFFPRITWFEKTFRHFQSSVVQWQAASWS
jgi:hypothetical protein